MSYRYNPFTNDLDDIGNSSGSGTPGGSNSQVQYNDNGSFGGSANLTWDETTKQLKVGSGFIDFDEIVSPTSPSSNDGRLFVKDVSGTTTLFFKDSAGTETNVLTPGNPAGSDGQIQFNNSGSFGADADFSYDSGFNVLNVNMSGGAETISAEGNIAAYENDSSGTLAIRMCGQSTHGQLDIFNNGILTHLITGSGNCYIGSVSNFGVGTSSPSAGYRMEVIDDVKLSQGYLDFDEIATPSNPSSNDGRLYCKDDSGTTKLYFRDSSGTETDLLAAGGGGSPGGSDTQVQFNNSGSFGGSADFTWNDTSKTLTFGANSTIDIPDTTANGEGIYFNGLRAFHNYGTRNFFAGAGAGNFTMTGTSNTACGFNALESITTGASNTGLGQKTLEGTTTGSNNVAIGSGTMQANVNGNSNMAAGAGALGSNISGSSNMGLGGNALSGNTTGGSNSGVGRRAGSDNQTGGSNTCVGSEAGRYINTSERNTFIGSNCARGSSGVSDNSHNLCAGYEAADDITSGSNNILLGFRCADSITSGDNCLAIGYDVELPSNTANNQLNIGNILFSEGIDGTGTTLSSGNLGIGNTSPAAKLHVDQHNSTGARPVARFTQADVSEQMLEFETTIGTGNAIEVVGGKTLTTTHFIKVTITGVGDRYLPCGTIA